MSNRRAFLGSAAVAAAGAATVGLPVQSALALGDYVPKFDDLKQIYQLGVTLDRLKDSVQNDQGKALAGLVAFNREPDFYSGYARNYISKSVKNNADGDSRVGKIRQVSETPAIIVQFWLRSDKEANKLSALVIMEHHWHENPAMLPIILYLY
jgi:hypothetical protein